MEVYVATADDGDEFFVMGVFNNPREARRAVEDFLDNQFKKDIDSGKAKISETSDRRWHVYDVAFNNGFYHQYVIHTVPMGGLVKRTF